MKPKGMKIFIAEDSILVRERLVSMIQEIDGMDVIGQAGTVLEANEQVARLRPDVALLDVRLADGNSFEVLAAIRKGSIPTRVIMMSENPLEQYRVEAMRLGSAYFFHKSTEFEKIVPALILLSELLMSEQSR
jgi:DNA-binding NarL/FixJ family response regulator